jgi:hypothetical protein
MKPDSKNPPADTREAVLDEIERAKAQRRTARTDAVPAKSGRTDRFG